jgi:hypothetical protein
MIRDSWQSDDGAIRLILGDALEVLPGLSGIDCVLTDPPFGKETHEGAMSSVYATQEIYETVNFDAMTEESFYLLVEMLCRISKRWVVFNCEWRWMRGIEERGLLIRFGIWAKPNFTPQFSGDRPGTGWEAVAICHRKGRKRWNGGGHPAVWRTTNPLQSSKVHRTQKPIALLEEWCRLFSDSGETICDPYMGSGTTGVACIRTHRRFIGIEINPEYYAIAKRRCIEELNRYPLLEPPRAKQRSFLEGEE